MVDAACQTDLAAPLPLSSPLQPSLGNRPAQEASTPNVLISGFVVYCDWCVSDFKIPWILNTDLHTFTCETIPSQTKQ